MDLQSNLIESKGNQGSGRIRKASAVSIVAHSLLIGAILFFGAQATHKVDAEDKPMAAFITQGAAPPPPPPPPPPAQAASSAPKVQPRIEPPKTQPQPTFVQPREIPKEIPKIEPIPDKNAVLDLTPDPEPIPSGNDLGAVAGAQPGGVPGGVTGGVVGGTVGGEVGGQIGGVVGGKIGGEVGGTGTGNEGTGTGGVEAPVAPAPEPEPPPTNTPLRVGGDVKAPVVVNRVEPIYTETARAGRVSGIVIVEAIIDKQGNVDAAKVVKTLPMGLSEAAVRAVRQWKFKPGTLNGEPVATIFNLTVNFKLN
jgi:protein TonB